MPSQRIGHAAPTNALLNQSLNESLPPPPPPKPAMNTKSSGLTTHPNASTTSVRSNVNASTTSVKSNANAKRAFDAAAKKKEQEAKAAQRKADQKREIEQKRAQRLVEERKLEQQRKAAEQQRVQEARKAAQRQAEEAKRVEQQRKEAQRPGSRQNNLARLPHSKTQKKTTANFKHQTSALQQEHAKHGTQRGDVGGTRPLAKANLVHDPPRPVIQVNPAKPPKRAMQFEDDGASQRPPNSRNPPSYQQLDAKRRKTQEEEPAPDQERRSVMQPPVRQSNIRKVRISPITQTERGSHCIQEPSKYTPYMTAHSGNQHAHNQSIYVSTANAQHVQQTLSAHHNEMSKYASGRIPFAEAPNLPAASTSHMQQQYKTPARNNTEAPASVAPASVAPSSAGPARSSPFAYPPPESVELPDIATDSEDEDPDKTPFKVPSWAESPALREALEAQQLKDPLKIFGPIPPLRMEEVFKNKDRQNKFRHRTSSANWSGTDKLTEDERKRDKRAREVLKQNGGWDMLSQKAAMGGSPYA
jgi:hypothetical protein